MAKKKTASGGMNRTERVAGTIFFLVYLLVMPLLATRIFDLLEVVLDTTINDSLRNVLYYYTLFAVTVLLFHSYLAHTSSRFLDNLNRALSTMLLGLLVFYGANELIFRVCNVLFNSRTNLNDMTIAASINAALKPADTNYLYYALDAESGTHKFFTNYSEFQSFVASQSYSQG